MRWSIYMPRTSSPARTRSRTRSCSGSTPKSSNRRPWPCIDRANAPVGKLVHDRLRHLKTIAGAERLHRFISKVGIRALGSFPLHPAPQTGAQIIQRTKGAIDRTREFVVELRQLLD